MAYNFNGTNQYLSVPDNATLDITGQLTIACFAKASTTISGAGPIVVKWIGGSNQRSYSIMIYQNKLLIDVTSLGTSASVLEIGGSTLIGTTQFHCAMSFTPSTNLTAYLNGNVEATTSSGVPVSIFNSTSPLTIGYLPINYFPGLIAEVGIWNAALTAAEIASLAKGMTCDKVRPQSLVFYAPLVRNLIDQKGGLTITNNNGATVANHPRVYA
jgi:hypothetical protein